MKRFLILLVATLTILPLATSALAGGPPPKDILKGVFISADAANRTAVFKKDGSGENVTLTVPESISFDEVQLERKMLVDLDKHATTPNTVKHISIMFMDMTRTKVIALIIIGLIGGLLSGFIGSGGAFVLTPAMMSLGAPGAVAVASNMCHKFPKAMVGTYKRFKYGQVDLKLAAVMAVTAVLGVQIGIQIQKYILDHWGNAGSNLYVSVVFVLVLILVGGYVMMDAIKLSKGDDDNEAAGPAPFALKMQQIKLPPMIHFPVAKVTISAWITVPVGLATGMLAATIAVGGFVGVPGMIYVIGASAVVASATELGIAFLMGAWGSIQWGISGLIDIRMTLLILSASLIGVQLGALGTTYVKDHMIKWVMASVMLIVAVSRGAKIPGYLAALELRSPLTSGSAALLEGISFWALIAALATAGVIISVAMFVGISKDRAEKRAEMAISNS